MDLSDLIDRNAAFTPGKTAVVFAGRSLTYAGLATRIERAASALKNDLGVGRGDRVAILATNHPDYLVALYACARLGAMLVTLNWRLAPAELVFILRDSGAKVLLMQSGFGAILTPLAEGLPNVKVVGLDFVPPEGAAFDALLTNAAGDGRNAGVSTDDPLLIVYTSGTTGRPKGAVLRQSALIANAVMSQHMHDMTSNDVVLTALPMFHVGGLNIQTTPALQCGATVVIHERFAPGPALRSIEEDRATLLVMVPATMQAMIEHPAWATARLTSLRSVSAGSTVVPQVVIDPFAARGVPVLQVYGSTETCPIAIYTRMGGDWRRHGSTGLPGLLCEARVVDDDGREVANGTAGEIEVRGPNILTHYWGDPRATSDTIVDGWYRTGDIAKRDADGHFHVHDRKKNMIISGAENIYPAEVERVLLMHPAIAEAAVIGRPDPRWQEVPVGCIVLRPGVAAAADEIEAFCLRELARYKVPRHYVFMPSLPRNVMGKVQHFMLREQVKP